MSVPSSKVTVTCESPNLEIERTPASRGSPETATSTCWVIWLSTSSGESDGAAVLTCTCTGVVSGKASMGSRERECSPHTTNANDPSMTRRRWRKDQPMIQFSIENSGHAVAPALRRRYFFR